MLTPVKTQIPFFKTDFFRKAAPVKSLKRKESELESSLKSFRYINGLHPASPQIVLGPNRTMATYLKKSQTPFYNKIILVDLDNMPLNASLLTRFPDTLFVIFISRNGNSSYRKQAMQSNCRVMVTPVVGKDACDVHICYYAHRLQCEFPHATFAIASRDHFAQILVGLMEKNTWHVCNEFEVERFLQKQK